MERLGERLARELWYCFAAKNLRRMVQFAQAFADAEIVASLMRQLSWTHVVALLPLKSAEARQHYARRSGTAANAQGRHHRRRILDRTAAQGGTGTTIACCAGRGARTAGAAGSVVGGGRG